MPRERQRGEVHLELESRVALGKMTDELRTGEYDEFCREQARAYLEHVRGLRLRVDALQEQIDDARASMLPGAVRYDKQGGAAMPSDDSMVEGIASVEALIAQFVEKQAEYVGELAEATKAVHGLRSGVCVKMLTLYYFRGRTWEDTASAMGYSEQRIYQLLNDALLELYEHMPHTWRAPRHQAI